MSASAVVTRPTDGDRDDHDLVAAVRSGDDRAFELLFQRYQPRIASYVRGMVRDHGRAEDITQEVFLSALRSLRAETEREIHFKAWIHEIAKNKCIDAFRRTRNVTEVSFDAGDAVGAVEHGRLADPAVTPDAAVEGRAAIDNLCGAFGGLSPVHHDILVLRELDGLSYREIGERLGMSRPAVESTLFRARRRLSQEYEELVSGERCLRVQEIVDASGARSAGLRDQRRMARHLAHCQSCRRYAGRAGLDLGTISRPAAAAARVAGLLPLPAFLRRRWGGDEAAPLLGHGGSFGPWSANVAATVDPGLLSSWTKAVATAATVAVAGMGAGAALSERVPGDGDGAVTPGSSFTHSPGPGPVGGAQGRAGTPLPDAAAGPAARGQRGRAAGRPAAAGVEPPAPVATAPTTALPASPATAPTPPRPAERPPSRPSTPDVSRPPAPVGAGTAAAERAVPDPAATVGRALGTVADGAGNADGAGGSVSGPAATGSVHDATAPVAGAAGVLDGTARTSAEAVLEDAPAVTAVVGSVSSTVSDSPASTTAAPNDLGG